MAVPFAILLPSLLYLYLLDGWPAFNALGLVSWANLNTFNLTAIPMFLLLAQILERGGLTFRVYRGLAKLTCWMPGGLLQTNIAGCAGFAAVTGSSVATAATIGAAALPQLEQRNYDRQLSAGSLAAGGTLGILVPPRLVLIIYSSFSDTSVARLFAAGVMPGIILTLMFMAYIAIRTSLTPSLAPREAGPANIGEFVQALFDIVPVGLLVFLVLGGLYLGWTTPSEAGALGCTGAIVLCAIFGTLTFRDFAAALRHALLSVGNILFLVFSAYVFSHAISFGGVGETFAAWIVGFHFSRLEFMLVLFVIYTVLGCLIEGVGMIVMTVPIIYPIMADYQIDPVWFGIILVIYVEMGMISPPIGINLFVIQGQWTGKLKDVVVGTLPFHLIMLVLLIMLIAWPDIALWLPNHMHG